METPASKTNAPVATCQFGPLRGTLVASKRLPYIYVQNWKCGCSTVKSSLWHAEHARGLTITPGYPHQQDGPFVRDAKRWEHCDREFVFTFVRNPFVRVLSAYLNQIVNHRNKDHWGRFSTNHGLGDEPVSFHDFLRLLAESPHDGMDPHWRPQYCSLAPALIPYDFVGTVENLNHDLSLVLTRIFGELTPVSHFAPHRTDATSKIQTYYGPAEVKLVQLIYQEDFASLGYDVDPSRLERVRQPNPPDASVITTWGHAARLVEEKQFVEAINVLKPLRRQLSGPNVDDLLRRCYLMTISWGKREFTSEDMATIGEFLQSRGGDANTWKLYGRALQRRGQIEDGLAAQLRALTMLDPSEHRDRRLRRIGWRLAMVRARRGRRAEALATLASLPAAGGNYGARERAVGFLQRSLLRTVGTLAAVTGTGLGRQQQQVEVADAQP